MARKAEKHVAEPQSKWPRWDPFGLMGPDLWKKPLRDEEISGWFAEMRATLEERWENVERSLLFNSLSKRLDGLFGRTPTAEEIRGWCEGAKQDHRWRIRLLDDKADEGRLYRAYIGLRIDNGFYHPDPGQGKRLQEIIEVLLDLERSQQPFGPPHLRGWRVVPGQVEKSKVAGKFFHFPMDGLTIPRRYSKGRARRLVTQFLSGRSTNYWADAFEHLGRLVAQSMKPYEKLSRLGLLEEALGRRSAMLVKTIRDPLLQLSDSRAERGATLTSRGTQRAVRLYRGWYPMVKKFVRSSKEQGGVRGIPANVIVKIRAAQQVETQPMRITLLMIVEELDLAIGTETLRRTLRPHLR